MRSKHALGKPRDTSWRARGTARDTAVNNEVNLRASAKPN